MFDLSGTLAEAFGWSIAQYNYRSGQVGGECVWVNFLGCKYCVLMHYIMHMLRNFEILDNFPYVSTRKLLKFGRLNSRLITVKSLYVTDTSLYE